MMVTVQHESHSCPDVCCSAVPSKDNPSPSIHTWRATEPPPFT